jgi:hypothetical protein
VYEIIVSGGHDRLAIYQFEDADDARALIRDCESWGCAIPSCFEGQAVLIPRHSIASIVVPYELVSNAQRHVDHYVDPFNYSQEGAESEDT